VVTKHAERSRNVPWKQHRVSHRLSLSLFALPSPTHDDVAYTQKTEIGIIVRPPYPRHTRPTRLRRVHTLPTLKAEVMQPVISYVRTYTRESPPHTHLGHTGCLPPNRTSKCSSLLPFSRSVHSLGFIPT